MTVPGTSEKKDHPDSPVSSCHGNVIREVEATFLAENMAIAESNGGCWQMARISGNGRFSKGRGRCFAFQLAGTEAKTDVRCHNKLFLKFSEDVHWTAIVISLKEDYSQLPQVLMVMLLEDVCYLVNMMLVGLPKAHKSSKMSQRRTDTFEFFSDADRLESRFDQMRIFIKLSDTLPFPTLNPLQGGWIIVDSSMILQMLSYLKAQGIKPADAAIFLRSQWEDMPRFVFETEDSSFDQPYCLTTDKSKFKSVALTPSTSVNLEPTADAKDSLDAVKNGNQKDTIVTIYRSEMLFDQGYCCYYFSNSDLSAIAIMVIMIFVYLLCFIGFYSEVMEKYRTNVANSTSVSSVYVFPF